MSDPSEYIRDVETYLCRKNEGHLVRIVGPVFEQVAGWAEQGVPLAIVCKGIDQYCARYYAKGPRRRPVRVEFCEGDVLDLFDAWRRAVGVGATAEEQAERGHESLPKHLDRVIARLTALRGGAPEPAFDRLLDETVRELDRHRAAAAASRGGARSAVLERLRGLDAALLHAASARLAPADATRLRAAAEAEIAPFAARMAEDARGAATARAFERLVRDAAGLPVVAFEE